MRKFWIFFLLICCTVYAKPIIITGIADKTILKSIRQQLTNKINNPTDTEIKFIIQYNTKQIYKVLYSYGYCDAEVVPINHTEFNIKLNNRYKLKEIIFKIGGIRQNPDINMFNTKKSSYINTKQIATTVKEIRGYYQGRGFALVEVNQPQWKINKQNKTITVLFNIELGPKIYIRNNIINLKSKKNPKLLKPFITNRITWKYGDLYNLDKLNEFKDNLIKYDLFSSIDISLGKMYYKTENLAFADVIINAEEAPVKEHSLSTRINTSNIYDIKYSWKHHNIDGKGSIIELSGIVSKNIKEGKITYNYYDLFHKNQELNTQCFGTKENTEAYNTTKFGANSTLWQTLSIPMSIGFGLGFERALTIDNTLITDEKINNSTSGDFILNISSMGDMGKNQSNIKTDKQKANKAFINTISPFLGIKFNNTNNTLDPQGGIQCTLDFYPNFSPKGRYTSITGKISHYFTLDKYTLATYIKCGRIFYDSTVNVPKDKLYFSGGAGSIRGYGYQKLGPLNNRTPNGGDSILEFCIEPRIKLSNTFGLAAFIEAGKVFNFQQKNKQNLMWGYGVGAIYYTQLGPIRIDIALPTKRRKDNNGKYIDSLLHFYVSIGHAF